MTTTNDSLITIGRTANADFPSEGVVGVPVKIDTGADSSSIWASKLRIDDEHALSFVLFGEDSPYYTGKVHTVQQYSVNLIRSSNGELQIRYRVQLPIVIGGKRVKGSFTLADRSKNTFPVLIGCSLLNKKFIVDVSRSVIKKARPANLNQELKANPKAFFEKYHATNERGDIKL